MHSSATVLEQAAPSVLPALRAPEESWLLAQVERRSDWPQACQRAVTMTQATLRARWMAEGRRMDINAPAALQKIVRQVAEQLNVSVPVEIYLVTEDSPRFDHAAEGPAIVLLADSPEHLGNTGLQVNIAQQLGLHLLSRHEANLVDPVALAWFAARDEGNDYALRRQAAGLVVARDVGADRAALRVVPDLMAWVETTLRVVTRIRTPIPLWARRALLAQAGAVARVAVPQPQYDASGKVIGFTVPMAGSLVVPAPLLVRLVANAEEFGPPGAETDERTRTQQALLIHENISHPTIDPLSTCLLTEAALAAAVIVHGNPDGVDEEFAERLTQAFDSSFWSAPRALDLRDAQSRFDEMAPALAALGIEGLFPWAWMLVLATTRTGQYTATQHKTLEAIFHHVGGGRLWNSLSSQLPRGVLGAPEASNITSRVYTPLPPRKGEAEAALASFFEVAARHSSNSLSLRRLLRLAGATKKDPEVIKTIEAALSRAKLRCLDDLASASMDQIIHVTPRLNRTVVDAPLDGAGPGGTVPPWYVQMQAPQKPTTEIKGPAGWIVKGLERLRDSLVAADGRSPTIRVHEARKGRVFDLSTLEKLAVGLPDRVVAKVSAGERCVVVDPLELLTHPVARETADALAEIAREQHERFDERGAEELFVGHTFVIGNASGYFVRAPLLLVPVRVVTEGMGAKGYALEVRGDAVPCVNLPLLRTLCSRRGIPLSDILLQEIDEAAAQGSVEAVLELVSGAGIVLRRGAHQLATHALLDRRDEVALWARDRLDVESCVALGFFPLSSSDVLQDIEGWISDIQQAAPFDRPEKLDRLGLAVDLLPAPLRQSLGAPLKEPSTPSPLTEIVPYVLKADPAQRVVLSEIWKHRVSVVQGPPGTGKSQLIVNLIGAALERGERVAVVSEKRAALDVVVQRLQRGGLHHAAVLVHDTEQDRRTTYKRVLSRLEDDPLVSRVEQRALDDAKRSTQSHLANLERRARALASRDARCSRTLAQWYSLLSSLADVPALAPLPKLADIDDSSMRVVLGRLTELRPYVDVLVPTSIWRGSRQSLATMSEAAMNELEDQLVDGARSARKFETALASCGTVQLPALRAAKGALEAARATRDLRSTPNSLLVFAGAFTRVQADPKIAEMVSAAESLWASNQDEITEFQHVVTFDPGPAFEKHIQTLLVSAGKWTRYLSISWWESERAVRRELTAHWPEKANLSFEAAFFDEVLKKLRVARAWRAATQCLQELGLAALIPTDAAAMTKLLSQAGTACRTVVALQTVRSQLAAAHAWPLDPSPESLAAWDGWIDTLRTALAADEKRIATLEPLRSFFTSIPVDASSAQLDALLDGWRRDSRRVAESDRVMRRLSELNQDAPALALQLAERLSVAPVSRWLDAATKAWATMQIGRLEGSYPELRAATTGIDVDLEADRLEAALDAASELERIRLSSMPTFPPTKVPRAVREAMLQEARKQRNAPQLRAFTRRFGGEGLIDLLPVWMLSPETLVTLFPRRPLFDVIIFDEASQVTVEHGLPVFLRAKRVCVVGDELQLPPTKFFETRAEPTTPTSPPPRVVRGGDTLVDAPMGPSPQDTRPDPIAVVESEATGAPVDMFDSESILALANIRCPKFALKWHYRSEHEDLIAFSNHAFYGSELLSAPRAKTPGPSFEWIEVEGAAQQHGRNEAEAARVVDQIAARLKQRPGDSLGVLTLNVLQRQAILDAIEKRTNTDEEFKTAWLTASSQPDLDSRPFVKNLENIQGDERDVILFSLGYAPSERQGDDGLPEPWVPARFGPLAQRGGERRLNVAITRARKQFVVVASCEPYMLSLGNTPNPGPTRLKQFIEFVRAHAAGDHHRAMRVLDQIRTDRMTGYTPSFALPHGYVPLAAQLAVHLESKGLLCELNFGSSEFQIPLVVGRPNVDAAAVAILCDEGDGPLDAFDRYVHRPALLRSLGWRVLRVDSKTFQQTPDAVVLRILRELPPPAASAPNA